MDVKRSRKRSFSETNMQGNDISISKRISSEVGTSTIASPVHRAGGSNICIGDFGLENIIAHTLHPNYEEGMLLYTNVGPFSEFSIIMNNILLCTIEECLPKVAIGHSQRISDISCTCFGSGATNDNLWCKHIVFLLLSAIDENCNFKKVRLEDLEYRDSYLSDFLWRNGEALQDRIDDMQIKSHFVAWRGNIGYELYLKGSIYIDQVYENILTLLRSNMRVLWDVGEEYAVFTILEKITEEVCDGMRYEIGFHFTDLAPIDTRRRILGLLEYAWTNFVSKSTIDPNLFIEKLAKYSSMTKSLYFTEILVNLTPEGDMGVCCDAVKL